MKIPLPLTLGLCLSLTIPAITQRPGDQQQKRDQKQTQRKKQRSRIRLIWMPALAAFALLALQAVVRRFERAWRMPSEILAAFGMTLAAAIGCTVAAGKSENMAIGVCC